MQQQGVDQGASKNYFFAQQGSLPVLLPQQYATTTTYPPSSTFPLPQQQQLQAAPYSPFLDQQTLLLLAQQQQQIQQQQFFIQQQQQQQQDFNMLVQYQLGEQGIQQQLPDPSFWKMSDFQILDTVGTGTFGRVRLCRHVAAPQHFFAIKSLDKRVIIDKKQVAHILNEKDVLSKIEHPFIVKLYKTMQDVNSLHMVMEYVCGGELLSHLRKIGRFPNDVAKFYIAELILAIEYLHANGFVYRDLKPENVLLDSKGHVKLTDFGFAKYIAKDNDRTWTQCGTPEYLAPEIILNKGHGKAVDWWTLGILLYEMLVGRPPFKDSGRVKLYDRILQAKAEFPMNVFIDPRAKDLITRLLEKDKTKRLGSLRGGADDIRNHAWFQGVDWYKVLHRQIPPPIPVKVAFAGDTRYYAKYDEVDTAIGWQLTEEQQSLFTDF